MNTHSSAVVAALIAFFIWRIYSRVRRLVGRQPSRLWRHRSTMLLFPTLIVLLGLGSLGHTKSLLALGAGILTGAGLAVIALRLTRFEVTPEGPFYTPYAPIGIALSALFVGRLVYRGLQLFEQGVANPGAMRTLGTTPITLLVFGTLASYYTAYAIGLLRWRSRLAAQAGLPPVL